MSDPVLLEKIDNIALIQLNNPPVNGLGLNLRKSLLTAFRDVSANPGVEAIVILSTSSVFCGGADINEFANGTFNSEPFLPVILDELEESAKPILAAINGVALGGGLELALACDYRMSTESAKLGLPEVMLGLIPGAGGTQRLPRFVGPEKALEMITLGAPISAKEGVECGLLDKTVSDEEDLKLSALHYAKDLVEQHASVKSCAMMSVDTGSIPYDFFDTFRQKFVLPIKENTAEEHCVLAIEAACQLPLAEGIKREAVLFDECMETAQSRAKQHLFFAERASAKLPGVSIKQPLRKIESVAILGTSEEAQSMAISIAASRLSVTVIDENKGCLTSFKSSIEATLAKSRKSRASTDSILGRIQISQNLTDLANADLVVETAPESGNSKSVALKLISKYAGEDSIVATTSVLQDMNTLAANLVAPQNLVGLNGFHSIFKSNIIEIGRGKRTADDVALAVMKLVQRIRKTPVFVSAPANYISNRMFIAGVDVAIELIQEGASPSSIDTALETFGMREGFCSLLDKFGLSNFSQTRQAIYGTSPSMDLLDLLIENGSLGKVPGLGLFQYADDHKQENTQLNDLVQQLSVKNGVLQRAISQQEIVDRVVFSLVNQGAILLNEHIACRSSDIDLVCVHILGFPHWHGGPMQFADETGINMLLRGLKNYTENAPINAIHRNPARLLLDMATDNTTFKVMLR